jgi:predicted GNAT family N-acyltransferase
VTAKGDYIIEPLGPNHDRAAFSCGVPSLDEYLQRQASQDQKRNLAAVFILTPDGKSVAGFYTLSAHAIEADRLPDDLARKLPRFPIPATLLGRMAIAQTMRGQGLGEFLLLHSLERALQASRQVASWAVLVDAKEGAREFYIKHDFIPFPGQPNRLFLPMKTIEKIFD